MNRNKITDITYAPIECEHANGLSMPFVGREIETGKTILGISSGLNAYRDVDYVYISEVMFTAWQSAFQNLKENSGAEIASYLKTYG